MKYIHNIHKSCKHNINQRLSNLPISIIFLKFNVPMRRWPYRIELEATNTPTPNLKPGGNYQPNNNVGGMKEASQTHSLQGTHHYWE